MLLLFDIGGTNTRIALAHREELVGQVSFATAQSYPEHLARMVQEARALAGDEIITSAVVGAPGPLDDAKTTLRNAPNLPDWIGQPLHADLTEGLKASVFLENDCALAGLGESVYGAGMGYAIVAYLAVGTGVGGARVVDKKIDRNAMGFEPGHQYIEGGVTLEKHISGMSLYTQTGQQPEDIDDPAVFREAERLFSYGIHNTIVHWSPEVVILGGGLIRNGRFSIDAISRHLQDILHIFPEAPPVIEANLGDSSGLMGALAYAKDVL